MPLKTIVKFPDSESAVEVTIVDTLQVRSLVSDSIRPRLSQPKPANDPAMELKSISQARKLPLKPRGVLKTGVTVTLSNPKLELISSSNLGAVMSTLKFLVCNPLKVSLNVPPMSDPA